MAEAFLALSGDLPGLRTLVVVKRILPHLSADDQFVRMFLDEARIGALLDHPNIPRIIEVGHDEDGYFLAMEAVPGKTLSAILRRAVRRAQPLGQADVAFIVGRAAAALGYAHAFTDADDRPLNIVHRDVSPENILVSFEGAVKVIDFGIASALGRRSETLVGGLKGKVEYMSPEQAAGALVDRRSDVFSLGIVLWEALSGRRLFRRDTDLAVMRAITDEPIPRPSGPRPIPAHLERIVMTALERSPEDRFQDAHEMALLLERYAFRTDGFDPAELVTELKQLFPADHAGWKKTVGMAQAVETSGPRNESGSFPLRGGASNHTAGPTLVLHDDPRREATTRADMARAFPAELLPDIEINERTALPRLTSWGSAQAEPESEGGERPMALGDDAAAYAALRAWAVRRTRLPGRRVSLLLVAAALVGAGVFAGLRSRAGAPVTPPSIAEVRVETVAAGSRPVVEPLRSFVVSQGGAGAPASAQADAVTAAPEAAAPAAVVMPAPAPALVPATTAATAPESPSPAPTWPAVRRSPPVAVRVVKKAVRKPAIAHHASAAAKPEPAARPVERSEVRAEPRAETRAEPRPLVRPGWRDPFGDR